MCGPRRLPGDRWDLTGPETVQGHSKPHLLSTLLTPEPGEGRDQQTGCVTQRVGSDLWRRVLSAFLPRPIHSRKQRDRSDSLEWFRALCIVTTAVQRPAPGGVSDPGEAGMGLPRARKDPSMWDQDRGGVRQRAQVCLCYGFCLGPVLQGGLSSGSPARAWGRGWDPGHRETSRAQERGHRARALSLAAARFS